MLPLLIALLGGPSVAQAFSFTLASAPAQCANLTMNWTGGTAPYEITLLPEGHVSPEIRTIVDNNRTTGSWEQQLLFPEGSTFIIVLSDATGFGTGGTSDVLTVGSGSSSCLPTSPSQTLFDFYLDPDTPAQCESFTFSWDDTAIPPIVISAVIPGGESFDVVSDFGVGITPEVVYYYWNAMLKEGTVVSFMVGDQRGRGTGGSSDLMVVTSGSSDSCLSGSYPTSTAAPPAGGTPIPSAISGSTVAAGPSSASGFSLITSTLTSTIVTGVSPSTTAIESITPSPSATGSNSKSSASCLFHSSHLGYLTGVIATATIVLTLI